MTDRIEEIRTRLEEATPGPWVTRCEWCGPQVEMRGDDRYPYFPVGDLEDATFIAHCRDDVPFLLSEIDAAKAENGQLRDSLRRARWAHKRRRNGDINGGEAWEREHSVALSIREGREAALAKNEHKWKLIRGLCERIRDLESTCKIQAALILALRTIPANPGETSKAYMGRVREYVQSKEASK